MSVLEDILEKLEQSTRYNAVLLTQMWQWIQKKEADKTPDDWQGTLAYVPASQSLQVLGHNQQRSSLSIINNGTVSVAISNRHFDDTEALNLNSDETAAGTYPFLVLPAGQSTTIGTRGAIYALSLSSSTAGQLTLIETIYSVPQSSHVNPPVALGTAGAMERGVDPGADRTVYHRVIV